MEMGQLLSIGRQKPHKTPLPPLESSSNIKLNIDYCALFPGNYIIVTGWAYHPQEVLKEITLVSNDVKTRKNDYDIIHVRREDVLEHLDITSDTPCGFSIIATLDSSWGINDTLSLSIETSSEQTVIELKPQPEETLDSLFNLHIKTFDTESKCTFLNKCITRFQSNITDFSAGLAKPLESIGKFIRVQIEKSIRLTRDGIFIYGWLIDSASDLEGIYIQSGTEISKNIIGSIYKFSREDVINAFETHAEKDDKYGILCYIPLKGMPATADTNILLTTKHGELSIIKLELSASTLDNIEKIEHILVNVDLRDKNLFSCLETHIHPALQTLTQHETSEEEIETRVYGEVSDTPECSIIIPIYGRYDFVLYQISQFVDDPDFQHIDITYVLDDPSVYDDFYKHCDSVYQTFKLPFRVVYSGKNLGFSGANNLGVKYALADKIILLNSDIIPDTSLWVSRMLETYDQLDNPGIIGTRLLFEDNTIQHTGLSYMQFPQGSEFHLKGMWWVDHPSKGLPDSLIQKKGPTALPAVTGACMMLDKSIYNEVGGMDESYILGDFEDSDLCLKVLEAGYTNYLIDEITLFHLERQSQNLFTNTGWKFKLTVYNGWQHSKRWGQKIGELNEGGE